jgi:hypothetical protein
MSVYRSREHLGTMRSNDTEHYRWLEFIAGFLLLTAGVASAWNSYQAERWSGVQATRYNRANALRIDAARASAEADSMREIDVVAFSGWLDAYAAGNKPLERFYRERFPAKFRPAFNKWFAAHPMKTPGSAPTPFLLPEYQLESEERATKLEAEAVQAFSEGQVANEHSDAYVLNSVVLALVLLFAGISNQFNSPIVKVALLCIAIALGAVAFSRIATYPVQ